MSKPADPILYEKVKKDVKKKVKVWPSAYASGLVVQEYKRRGGKYIGKKRQDTGIDRWFNEKWIDVCQLPKKVPCARPRSKKNYINEYPYCRPSVRVNKKTPKTVRELSKKELQKRCSRKRKTPSKRVMPNKKSRARKN